MNLPDFVKDTGFLPIALACCLLYMAFSDGIFLDYAVHNDYSVFSYENRVCCTGYPESQHLFWIGRPIGAILLNIQFAFIDQIRDFRWLRLAAFGLLLLILVLVYSQFRCEAEGRSYEALLASLGIALLPSSILYIFWATNTVPGLVNLILASTAYRIVYWGYTSDRYRMLKIASGYFSLGMSFFIYPPTSYGFLIFTCWRALMTNKLSNRLWAVRSYCEVAIVGIMSGMYVLALKLISTPRFMSLIFRHVGEKPSGQYSTTLALNWQDRLETAQVFIKRSFEIWFEGWASYPYIVLFLIVASLTIPVCGSFGLRDKLKILLGRATIPILCFFLAGLPMIASSGGFVTTRNGYVGSAIVCVVILSGVFRLVSLLNRPLVGIALGSGIVLVALMTGSYRFSQAADNAHMELQYLRTTLSQFSPHISAVTVYCPSWDSTILDVPPSDFTLMAVNKTPIEGFPRGILKELGLDYRNIPVSFATSEKRIHIVDNVEICMDRAGFAEIPARTSPCDRGLSDKDTPPHVWIKLYDKDNLVYGILRAFDESLQEWSFWETPMRAPIVVDLEYETAQTLLAYTFQSGPAESRRMPISWTTSGSIDGVTWIPIDEHREMEIWRDNEERKFVVKSPGPHRFYRFVFEKAEAPEIMRIYEIGLHLSQ